MVRPPAVEVARQVWRIPTVGRNLVNSFAFVDDNGSVTLVDCGLAKAPPRIVAGLAAMGKRPADVTRILLTHVHPDHAGGAAELSRQTGADVWMHQGDHPSATAGTIVPKPDQRFLLGRLFGRLPDPHFEPFQPGPLLNDGDVLPVAGGVRVGSWRSETWPGECPGVWTTRTLVTGDAMFNFGFRGLSLSPKFLCADFALTQQTVHRLGELDYDVAAFTHGPEMTERPRERIRDFLSRLARGA
jgi:glyoxylase-like metal-dependent hydrolase (beta-lactamase superfamily II)